MSKISQIYSNYSEALTFSRNKYHDLYHARACNADRFYRDFFHRLILPMAPHFADPATRRHIHRHMERFFGNDKIDFVAVDGTSKKIPFQDFLVFFACAYGAKGQISLTDQPPVMHYHKWSIDKDVSMVTYMPVPYAEFADIADQDRRETFLVSDSDRVDLSTVDTLIMELAEIFLAYNMASSSSLEFPRMIMMDRSPSSMLADVALRADTIPMLGYPYDRRQLLVTDAQIALAHPFHGALGIPSAKKFRQYWMIIAEFHHKRSKELDLNELAARVGMAAGDFKNTVDYLEKHSLAYSETRHGNIRLVTDIDMRASWEYVIALFENICRRLFIEKDHSALLYEAPDEQGIRRLRWISPDDLRFLIAVGIRALIEKCWERNIILTGIIKDSSSRYLTRNYLGVMKLLGEQGYPELNHLDVRLLPWTDRIFLELLPVVDEELSAPWSTIEFDSTYMTLHAEQGSRSSPTIAGIKQFIVSPERLFARSLGQFFIKRDKPTPLTGHVVFIERLVFPDWDMDALERITIETGAIGRMQPLCYRTKDDVNLGQMINLYLLNLLTRNHFPEVIGYPDPLHKADWGAKSVGDRAYKMIASSLHSFRSQPLSRTFRTIRDSFHR